jgi:hypothetical protein
MLPFALPDELVRESSAGTWGCFVCGLPSKGAIAVLCDRCGAEYEKHDTGLGPIRMVVVGTPADNDRVPVGVLNGPQEHDHGLHSAYEERL